MRSARRRLTRHDQERCPISHTQRAVKQTHLQPMTGERPHAERLDKPNENHRHGEPRNHRARNSGRLAKNQFHAKIARKKKYKRSGCQSGGIKQKKTERGAKFLARAFTGTCREKDEEQWTDSKVQRAGDFCCRRISAHVCRAEIFAGDQHVALCETILRKDSCRGDGEVEKEITVPWRNSFSGFNQITPPGKDEEVQKGARSDREHARFGDWMHARRE